MSERMSSTERSSEPSTRSRTYATESESRGKDATDALMMEIEEQEEDIVSVCVLFCEVCGEGLCLAGLLRERVSQERVFEALVRDSDDVGHPLLENVHRTRRRGRGLVLTLFSTRTRRSWALLFVCASR